MSQDWYEQEPIYRGIPVGTRSYCAVCESPETWDGKSWVCESEEH